MRTIPNDVLEANKIGIITEQIENFWVNASPHSLLDTLDELMLGYLDSDFSGSSKERATTFHNVLKLRQLVEIAELQTLHA